MRIKSTYLLAFILLQTVATHGVFSQTLPKEKVPLYEALSERDAIEVILALQEQSILAEKIKTGVCEKTQWAVWVSDSDLFKARKVLINNELPRRRPPTPDEICGAGGMIRTLAEERCRESARRNALIINLLQDLPGVLKASVVISNPEENSPPQKNFDSRWKASIALKVKSSSSITVDQVQKIVANALANIKNSDITVSINRIDLSQP